MEEDAFIFSCDWDNYQNNILIDKEIELLVLGLEEIKFLMLNMVMLI